MSNFKFTLSYDGTDFAGWQTQPGFRTIQETFELAVEAVTGSRPNAIASGRTDSGVHAVGQVVNFHSDTRLSPHKLLRAVNSKLPDDLVVREAVEVPEAFNANKDAVRKLYRYVIRDHPVADPFLRR